MVLNGVKYTYSSNLVQLSVNHYQLSQWYSTGRQTDRRHTPWPPDLQTDRQTDRRAERLGNCIEKIKSHKDVMNRSTDLQIHSRSWDICLLMELYLWTGVAWATESLQKIRYQSRLFLYVFLFQFYNIFTYIIIYYISIIIIKLIWSKLWKEI